MNAFFWCSMFLLLASIGGSFSAGRDGPKWALVLDVMDPNGLSSNCIFRLNCHSLRERFHFRREVAIDVLDLDIPTCLRFMFAPFPAFACRHLFQLEPCELPWLNASVFHVL